MSHHKKKMRLSPQDSRGSHTLFFVFSKVVWQVIFVCVCGVQTLRRHFNLDIQTHAHTLLQMQCPHLSSLGSCLGGWSLGWCVERGGFGSLCGGYRVGPKYISAWKLLSHRPLIRLPKCGIDFSLFQMEKKINIFQLSTMLLNFLCHILLRRPRRSRGKGQESTLRENEVFPAIHHHASCPFPALSIQKFGPSLVHLFQKCLLRSRYCSRCGEFSDKKARQRLPSSHSWDLVGKTDPRCIHEAQISKCCAEDVGVPPL